MTLGRRALLGVASALAFAIVRAEGPLEPPDLSRYVRWGPVRVRPGFAVPALGYDDNILAAGGSAKQLGGFGIRLSPRMDGVVLLGHATFLTFRERLDYTAYANHGDLNYLEHMGSYRLTVPFRRFGVYADLAANRLKDSPLSEIDSRPVRRELRTGAGVIVELGWRTDAEIGLVKSDWTVTDPDFLTTDGLTIGDFQNRTEDGRRVKIRYRLTALTRLTFETSRRDIVFDNRSVARDSRETAFVPGLELGVGGRMTGAIRLGRMHLDALTVGAPDLTTTIGDARLAYRLSSATTIRVEGDRKAGFGVYQGNRYYVSSFYEGRYVHFLNRVLGVEAAVGTGRLTYPENDEAGARTDRNRRAEAGVRFRLAESALGRQTDYTVFVRRWRRDSTLDVLDQSRTVVGIAASVGF